MPSDTPAELAIVDALHADFQAIAAVLADQSEVSLQSTLDNSIRKTLLLAAASGFESKLTDIVAKFADSRSEPDILVPALIRNKAISRQYHTWFNWEGNNANQFFGLFGGAFKSYMSDALRSREDVAEAIRAFLEIGAERNRLVHQNFASYTLEKTSNEIYELFKKAQPFLTFLPEALQACSEQEAKRIAAERTQEQL